MEGWICCCGSAFNIRGLTDKIQIENSAEIRPDPPLGPTSPPIRRIAQKIAAARA
jgi:hypothetical protein